jgi:hypothetical protein
MHQDTATAHSGRVGWLPRLITYGAVALVLVAGLAGREIWPLSGFFLFSYERTAQQQAWELAVVDESGTERTVNLGDLPDNYSGYVQLMPKMLAMPQQEQQEVIAAWLDGLGVDASGVVAAKVYLVDSEVPTEVGEPPVEESRSEMLTVNMP